MQETSPKPVPRPAAGASSSGEVSLRDRVRSLQLPSDAGASRSRSGWWIALCLLLGATNLWFVYLWYGAARVQATAAAQADQASKQESASRAAATSAASSAAPEAAAGEIALISKGYVIPAHQILVSPKVVGMVVELNVEEGRRVQKGEVLAVLEATEYEADKARAESTLAAAQQRLAELERGSRPEEIEQAEAELAEAEAQKSDLERILKRAKELFRMQVITDQELERAETDLNAMLRRMDRLAAVLKLVREGPRKERIAAAQAEVRQAEAELAKTQWRLDNCTILAPISGTILKKNAEEGNIVNPVAFNGSFSLCDMADLSDLEVDLAIQERDVHSIFVGQECTVRADAYPDRRYKGVVSRLMPIADRGKGAVPVRVKVQVPAEEEGVYLKPEMSAEVSFYAPGAKAAEPAESASAEVDSPPTADD